jgi:hypothetical protein
LFGHSLFFVPVVIFVIRPWFLLYSPTARDN